MNQRENPSSPGLVQAGGIFSRPVLLCLLIMAATMAMRAPLLRIPFERDEGEYAYIGWRMELDELPYRDWVDQKPPGIFWVYRLALAFPLEPVFAVHLVAALFAASSAGALFLLARRFLERFWAAMAGLLLGLLAAAPAIQGNAANTEVFMQLPLILSLLALLEAASRENSKTKFMFLSGVLAGLAVLFKQVAAIHWLFLVLVYPMFRAEGKWGRNLLAFASWSAFAAAIVWGVVMAYFGLQHGWHDFFYNVLLHNLDYIAALPPADRLFYFMGTTTYLARSQAIIWLFAILGGASLLKRGQKQWFLMLGLWMTTSAVGVNASGYFFPHYFQSLLPALALAAAAGAAGLDHASGWAQARAWRRRATLVVALGLLPAVAMFPFLFLYTPKEAVAQIYPGNPFGEMPDLGRRLAEITRPEDRVFIFGSEPELLFYARRASATRYIFLFPLFGPYADAHEKQVATALEITQAHPAAALYLANDLFNLRGTDLYFDRWSYNYLHTNFQADQWLGCDAAGSYYVRPALKRAAPPTNMVGELMVRKNSAK